MKDLIKMTTVIFKCAFILCARCHAKYFKYIILFELQTDPMKKYYYLHFTNGKTYLKSWSNQIKVVMLSDGLTPEHFYLPYCMTQNMAKSINLERRTFGNLSTNEVALSISSWILLLMEDFPRAVVLWLHDYTILGKFYWLYNYKHGS